MITGIAAGDNCCKHFGKMTKFEMNAIYNLH